MKATGIREEQCMNKIQNFQLRASIVDGMKQVDALFFSVRVDVTFLFCPKRAASAPQKLGKDSDSGFVAATDWAAGSR